jgi:hypothetical protein
MKRLAIGLVLAAVVSAVAVATTSGAVKDEGFSKPDFCTSPGSSFRCLDVANTDTIKTSNAEYPYVGHDEPSLLFYSNKNGSGYDQTWQMTLPAQHALPNQTATGGFWDFQLHPAFWFGMAMCDTQSFPVYQTSSCPAHSDSNIFDNPSSSSPNYIGHHPGTAFMEMQFYPPGWVSWPGGDSCDATKWCAALNIDSLTQSGATGIAGACAGLVGIEPVGFAFITKSGVPHAPPNPLDSTLATFTPNTSTDLFMNSGDKLVVHQVDTPSGLHITINDLTTGASGSMTTSAANGWGQVPYSGACNNIPYNFHPMYATSSEHTRVPRAAHSYNVAFSDEIGHWDDCTGATLATRLFGVSCPGANTEGAAQGTPEAGDPGSGDNGTCWPASQSTLAPVQGCLGTNSGFDGTAYSAQAWPGTGNSLANTPSPITFKSPYINGSKFQQFDRVGFETDLPRSEVATSSNPNLVCNRTTGVGCVNPPPTDDPTGENAFYPTYTTGQSTGWLGACAWRLGGPNLPSTFNTFGGTPTAEYGPLLQSVYQSGVSGAVFRYNNFRQILSNTCLN